MSVPKLFVFDLDGCCWEPEMYQLWGACVRNLTKFWREIFELGAFQKFRLNKRHTLNYIISNKVIKIFFNYSHSRIGGSPFTLNEKNGNLKDAKNEDVYLLGAVREILYELKTEDKFRGVLNCFEIIKISTLKAYNLAHHIFIFLWRDSLIN